MFVKIAQYQTAHDESECSAHANCSSLASLGTQNVAALFLCVGLHRPGHAEAKGIRKNCAESAGILTRKAGT